MQSLAFGGKIETTYIYDISAPSTFRSANNRLMKEIVENVSPAAASDLRPSPEPIRERKAVRGAGGRGGRSRVVELMKPGTGFG